RRLCVVDLCMLRHPSRAQRHPSRAQRHSSRAQCLRLHRRCAPCVTAPVPLRSIALPLRVAHYDTSVRCLVAAALMLRRRLSTHRHRPSRCHPSPQEQSPSVRSHHSHAVASSPAPAHRRCQRCLLPHLLIVAHLLPANKDPAAPLFASLNPNLP
ncbi:hypothetical protein U1Q18_000799, partial [Sarracenia purpurea var. burkii]